MMSLTTLVWDNPILVKFVRSRLRRQQVIPLLTVVLLIAGALTWGSYSAVRQGGDANLVFVWLVILQGVLLLVIGAGQVATAIAQARETGMLDFHRLSPQSPAALVVGFALGAPIREYLAYILTIPFFILIGYLCEVPFLALALLVVGFVVLAAFNYLLAMTVSLSVPANSLRSAGALLGLVLILVNILWALPPVTFFTALPLFFTQVGRVVDVEMTYTFFGMPMSGFLISLLHQAPLIVFLWFAALRKMRHERLPGLSRPMLLSLFVFVGLVSIGDVVATDAVESGFSGLGTEGLALSLLMQQFFLALFLVLSVTPNAGQFLHGVRYYRKLGIWPVPQRSDRAGNLGVVLVVSLLLFVIGCGAAYASGISDDSLPLAWLAAGVSATAVLTIGLGAQAFYLRFRKNGVTYFTLFVFLAWIMPLIIGLLGYSTTGLGFWALVMCFSPLAGIFIPITGTGYEHGHVSGIFSLGVSFTLALILLGMYVRAARSTIARAIAAEEEQRPAPITPPTPAAV
jgi:hypothetical protein